MAEVLDETAKEVSAGRTQPRLALVLSGILPGDRTRIQIGPGSCVLGRAPECNVRLDFAEMSRQHAVITHEGSTVVLRDLGSTNGTHVDGRRVTTAALREGSLVRLGTWLGIAEGLTHDELNTWCTEAAPGLWGGALIQRVLGPLRSVAKSTLPVVLVGATGTGKERFAAAIHHASGRSGPLHAVNCAALPSALAESELFGHERGAFTGADLKTRGHFRAAEGGTLFLDELQELSSSLQAKVLRAVETHQVTPLGESRAIEYDARIVVASQRPLAELVAAGSFREDLAMRLGGLHVAIPALERRLGDVPTLFDHFLREHASGAVPSVSTKFYERLCSYRWPGNVRELQLLARRMLALHAQSKLCVAELPAEFSAPESIEAPGGVAFESRDDQDRQLLHAALGRTGGNLKRAAELANVSRARAYRLLGKRPSTEENAPD